MIRKIIFSILIALLSLNCMRQSTVHFIHMGMQEDVRFRPKRTEFGVGVVLNGIAIEIGGTFLTKIDSLEVYKDSSDTFRNVWKIKNNATFSPSNIMYGKPPRRYKQLFPLQGEPEPLQDGDIIRTIFFYKGQRDTIDVLYKDNTTTTVIKSKKK